MTLLAAAPAFVAAWLWWSLATPRWRLWALANLDDASGDDFRREAVRQRLLWPAGHWFERSEIRPRNYSLREQAAETAGQLRQLLHRLRGVHEPDLGGELVTRLRTLGEQALPVMLAIVVGERIPMQGSRDIAALGAEVALHLRNASLEPEEAVLRGLEAALGKLKVMLDGGLPQSAA